MHLELLRAYDQDLFWDRHDRKVVIAVALEQDDICCDADLLDLRRAEVWAMCDHSDMLNPDTPSPSWLIRKLQSKTAQGRTERTLATLEYTEGLLRGAK